MPNSQPIHAPPLGRECYCSQSVYDAEQERIFRRHWIATTRATALSPDGFQTLNVAQQPLVIVQAAAATIRCFHNVCRHRGALLLESDTSGTLTGGCVTCPYHAWRYDSSGRLVSAPNLQADERSAAELGLIEVACRTWNGYLMVHLGDDPPDVHREFSAMETLLEPWHIHQLQVAAQLEYAVAANWKLLFQNYSECYHCPTVHPRLNRMSPYRTAANHLTEGPLLGGPMQLADGVASMTSDGNLIATPLPGLNAAQRRQVCYYTLFPTMFISPHPDYVMVHRVYPQRWDQTRVVCEFLVAEAGSADLSRAVDFWDQVNREDWHVCERVQSGAQSHAFRSLHYTGLEATVAAFDRHYRSVMGNEAGDRGAGW